MGDLMELMAAKKDIVAKWQFATVKILPPPTSTNHNHYNTEDPIITKYNVR